MTSRVYERTHLSAGAGITTRVRHAARHVTLALAGWLDTDTETTNGNIHVGHVDEIARREEVQLVRRVFLAPGPRACRTVLFAGIDGDNGCASICVRAGQILAQLAPQSVCVVDANVRSPALHGLVSSDNRDGFTTAVECPESGPRLAQRWAPGNMWLLPSGSSSIADLDLLVTPDRARACLQALAAQFHHLLVYVPPINLYAESLALGQLVDGVVLVLEANATRREIVRNTKARLEELNVPLLGIVLNDRTFPIPDALYRLL